MSVLKDDKGARKSLEIHGQWSPARQGYHSWTAAPETFSLVLTLLTGRLYLSQLPVDAAFEATALDYYVSVAAATPTAGQCFVGLYDEDGGVVAQYAAETDFGLAGTKSLPLTGTLTPGSYRFAILFNGTTGPQIPRAAGATGGPTFFNTNLAAANYRGGRLDTQTSLPDPIAYSSTTEYLPFWAALR